MLSILGWAELRVAISLKTAVRQNRDVSTQFSSEIQIYFHYAKLDLKQAARSAAWLQIPSQGNECFLSWCLEFLIVS